ncbi:MAG: outer membrane beta-barrel protein [Akkermansiaceae bacterium]|nr:outer membrane beta-barrel protein [Akkermansiaceae bacterium]MCP5550012.1 outer membrane beta-barrel protein [Akkermansiaceae bacterium]
MKKLLSTLAILTLTAGLATAGDWSKNPVEKNPIPVGCACFDPGFEFSGFIAGGIPDNGDSELGGGASASYFFTENVGVELSYAVLAFDSEEHVITGNLVYRMPLKDLCIAPYLLVGGGLLTNSATDGLFDVGGGLDIRFDSMGCLGLFADATYNWVDGDRDFTLIRSGVRVRF